MDKDSDTDSKLIPMRKLIKLTSLTRATINFYIKEGILPPPQKTAKNMAYYDEEFVRKLKIAETMKNEKYSLDQIKRLINSNSGSVNDFCFQILDSVNRLLPYGMNEAPVTLHEIRDIGLDKKTVRHFIDAGIIIPLDSSDELFPAYSLTICNFLKYFLDLGIPLSVAEEMISKLQELASIEKSAFVEYIRSPMIEKQLPPDDQKIQVENCIQTITAMLQILHLQYIKLPTENLLRSSALPAKEIPDEEEPRHRERHSKNRET